MNNIKIAGLGFEWSREYAKSYSDTLLEMGFYAKPEPHEGYYIVIYSPFEFDRSQALNALNKIEDN